MVWPEKMSMVSGVAKTWFHLTDWECKMVWSPWEKKKKPLAFPQKVKCQTATYSFILLLEL